jgi:hypothetical protein
MKQFARSAFWGILIIALIIVGGSVLNVKTSDNKYILMVKGGYPLEYPNQTYGNAFSNFFRTPKWSYLESKDGDKVVEFTGDCVYMDVEVKATLQFIVNEDDGTFEAHYLGFNEVPQNKLILGALIKKAFEDTPTTSNNQTTNTSGKVNVKEVKEEDVIVGEEMGDPEYLEENLFYLENGELEEEVTSKNFNINFVNEFFKAKANTVTIYDSIDLKTQL